MSQLNRTSLGDQAGNRLGRGLCAVFALELAFFVSLAAAPVGVEAVGKDRAGESRTALVEAASAEVAVPAPGFDVDDYVKQLIVKLKDQRQKNIAPGIAAQIAPPIEPSRARFDLLPNWDIAQNAILLLPNFEDGSAQCLLIEQGMNSPPKAIVLDPITVAPRAIRHDR